MECGMVVHPCNTPTVCALWPLAAPQDQWDTVKRQVQELTASSQYSNQPAIYGMVAGAEAARLRGEVPTAEGEHCCCCCCCWRALRSWHTADLFGGVEVQLHGCSCPGRLRLSCH